MEEDETIMLRIVIGLLLLLMSPHTLIAEELPNQCKAVIENALLGIVSDGRGFYTQGKEGDLLTIGYEVLDVDDTHGNIDIWVKCDYAIVARNGSIALLLFRKESYLNKEDTPIVNSRL